MGYSGNRQPILRIKSLMHGTDESESSTGETGTPGKAAKATPQLLQGPEGVIQMGHRGYVGGLWEEIGSLQFEFLKSQGLRPEHVLLDIGCGSLRLGSQAIPYLQPCHYIGIDKEQTLLDAGANIELDRAVLNSQQPQLFCNADFAFEKIARQLDMAIAHSLFTHLPPALISRCLKNLSPWLGRRGQLFATFFEVELEIENPAEAHDHGYFGYTRQQMENMGREQGYAMRYIGAWKHPRHQMMVAYHHG